MISSATLTCAMGEEAETKEELEEGSCESSRRSIELPNDELPEPELCTDARDGGL
jgi:hypothetical protein